MKYTLGFAFDDKGQVALIEKRKPEWQRGLLNGIGGKIEPLETYEQCMSREFLEETGVHVEAWKWRYAGAMIGSVGFTVYVFTYTGPEISNCKTTESEVVSLVPVHALHLHKCIENVPALVALCQIPIAPPSNVQPLFRIEYGSN